MASSKPLPILRRRPPQPQRDMAAAAWKLVTLKLYHGVWYNPRTQSISVRRTLCDDIEHLSREELDRVLPTYQSKPPNPAQVARREEYLREREAGRVRMARGCPRAPVPGVPVSDYAAFLEGKR